MDFEYKQNRRTHSFTLTPRTCTHAYTHKQTSIYADESTHTHLGISIRINNYTNSMRRLSHGQAHAQRRTHLIQSLAHTHIRAHTRLRPLLLSLPQSSLLLLLVLHATPKKRQQNIKIKFFRFFPPRSLIFVVAAPRSHPFHKKYAVLFCSALPPSFAQKLMAKR